MSQDISGRFFAVKTTGGQEKNVANMAETRIKMKSHEIHSILLPDSQKGYIYIEAANAQIVGKCVTGTKHVKNIVPGIIQFQDIERFLVTKSAVSELDVGDAVSVISGPFKRMNATITKIESSRSEATIILLDAQYPMPITVPASYLKIIQKAPLK